MSYYDSENTLPSIAEQMPDGAQAEELRLTVIFHPDSRRIGQVACVPRRSGLAPWVLGRGSPLFGGCSQPTAPLDDPHISRQAVELDFTGSQLRLSRVAGSSRCRCGEEEVFAATQVNQRRLRAGVTLALSHSVVLLARLVTVSASASADAKRESELGSSLVGSSDAMQRLRREIAHVAASDVDVLIRGETGTGKELVAQAIHRTSRRAGASLISVNMAAIPEELAAAALFGSARGAFTGAERKSPGYFRIAQGGCLFLDEIGDTPQSVQPLLLRALQQREIQAVGGGIYPVDVRVLSATDVNLEDIERGFRAALRHRLASAEVQVPALRERPEDIGELLWHFLTHFAREHGKCDLLPNERTSAAQVAVWANVFALFARYPWPGNVRELENYARQIVLQSTAEPQLAEQVLHRLTAPALGSNSPASRPMRRMQDVTEEDFAQAMVAQRFEIQAVARQLGVSRTAVYRRIEAGSRFQLASQVDQRSLQSALDACAGDVHRAALALEVSASSLRRRLREVTPKRR